MRRALLCAAVAIVDCGGGGKGGKTTPGADLGHARAAVEKFVNAQYGTIRQGDAKGYAATLAPDVVFFGSTAEEALVGRAAVQADVEKVYGPALAAQAQFVVEGSAPKIGVAPDGRAAWVADEVNLGVVMNGQKAALPYRVTSLLAEKGGNWTTLAQHWSIGVPNDQAFKNASEGTWPALADLPGNVGKGAEPVAAAYQSTASDATSFVGSFSDRADAFTFGSAPEEKVEGGAQIRQVFLEQIKQWSITVTGKGGVRAGLAPSGSVGFVAGNIDFTATVQGTSITQPYRELLVYLKEGGKWRLVQAHFSNGLAPAATAP